MGEGALEVSPKHFAPKRETQHFQLNIAPSKNELVPKKYLFAFVWYYSSRINAFELMNFLSACIINRIFDVELIKENETVTPLKLQKELSTQEKKAEVSKKIELCQYFTVNRNLKEIYDTVMRLYLLGVY